MVGGREGRGETGRVFPVTSPLLVSPLMSGHLVSALDCLLSVSLSSLHRITQNTSPRLGSR